MKPKKTKKADLNNYSFSFILIGLVVVMFITLKVINMKTYASAIELDDITLNGENIDQTEVIKIEEPKPEVKIEKPRELVQLKIEEDDKNIEEDLFKDSEPEEKEEIEEAENLETAEVEEGPSIEVPWTKVEQVPVFPGCEKYLGDNSKLKKCMNEKVNKFISRKFNPEIAQEIGLSGTRIRIFTQFTIDENGKITNIKTRSQHKELAGEAKRVIRLFPSMKPGKQRDKTVRVTYTLPIVFNVADE